MTIQVVSTEGFNPSLTGIHPYDTSSHNFEVVATGGVSASQNREIAVNFPVDFDKFYEDWRMATIQAKLLQPAIDDAKKNVEAYKNDPAKASQYSMLAAVAQKERDDAREDVN